MMQGYLNVLHISDDDGFWTFVGAVAAGAGAVVAAPAVLTAAGFTTAGIAAGSLGASMMSASAIANGGGVVAGELWPRCSPQERSVSVWAPKP